MIATTPRVRSIHVSASDVAVLDDLLKETKADVLKEFARCFFVSLRSLPGWREQGEAELSVVLMKGVAEDLGGVQYYIPSERVKAERQEQKAQVLRLLNDGASYREVSRQTGFCESQVRKVERNARAQRLSQASK